MFKDNSRTKQYHIIHSYQMHDIFIELELYVVTFLLLQLMAHLQYEKYFYCQTGLICLFVCCCFTS